MPVLKCVKLLKALMVEDNIEAKDLVGIWENEIQVSEVLNGERQMTATQMQKLAEFFHVSAAAFLE